MRIRIEFQGPGFVAVPNHVAAMVPDRLSVDALGALVRLALLPSGSDWNVATVLSMLGCGREKWQRLSRELRAIGALFDDVPTDAGGRLLGRVLGLRWPDPVKVKAGRKPGKPKAGKPGHVEPGKPKAGKPGFRSAQAVELIEKNSDEGLQKDAPLNTKTGEAAAPTGGEAASPVCHFVPISAGPDGEAGRASDPESRARVAAMVAAFVARATGPCASGAGTGPGSTAEN